MTLPGKLVVRGAREHNLKGVDLELPHRTLTVFTGVSGSGKSSLAFATIYAEGQRRQLQSMSTFARQFMNQMDKPAVDRVDGMCSAVAVDQRSSASRSPRSTVGTVTEVYDLMRVAWARIGHPHCTECGRELKEGDSSGPGCPGGHPAPVPDMSSGAFSFNLPFGQCTGCLGVGTRMEVAVETLVTDEGLSLPEGALAPWRAPFTEVEQQKSRALVEAAGFPLETPWRELPKELRDRVLFGTDIPVRARKYRKPGEPLKDLVYTGVAPWLHERYRAKANDGGVGNLEVHFKPVPCGVCGGGRLLPAQLAVKVGGLGIAEASRLPVDRLLGFFRGLEIPERDREVAEQAVGEIVQRLGYLIDVGLGYLTLERAARTLSGGESQRIRLASLLGQNMFGLLYVLDEPSAGLHPKDTEHLVSTLRTLRDQGNTVLVVEHDHQVIRASDWVVELGPAAGEHGGELTYSGTVPGMLADPASLTGGYLTGRRGVVAPERRTPGPGHEIVVRGAREHNLTGIDVSFPLGCFVAVTGVSGAGKSTLIDAILYPAAERALGGDAPRPGEHDGIDGLGLIDRVIKVDQAPIGRSGRSTPATYTGVFDAVRKVFAQTDEAKRLGYKPGRFSFNSAGGRCENCAGDGTVKVEMYFLPDVFLLCEECGGTRYNEDTLRVHYRGRTIAEVLEMPIADAVGFFEGVPAIAGPLRVLDEVGLGYLRLGQPANTLSGGEAQRIKLANELQRKAGKHTLYLLDEPTNGLHSSDTERLLDVLHSLVGKGHTVITVTHSLEVVKTADWVIDIGPEGGNRGGGLVAAGTPEEVAAGDGHTGRFLREAMERDGAAVEEAAA